MSRQRRIMLIGSCMQCFFYRMSDIPMSHDKCSRMSSQNYVFEAFSHVAEMVLNNVVLFLALFCSLCFVHGEERKCEKITITMCQNVGYNLTYMPNMFKHGSQQEATLDLNQFWPLVQNNCSRYLKIFLCSMYVPRCQPSSPKEILPCRPLCEQARKDCTPLLRRYGFSWPQRMRCQLFPKLASKQMCMDRNTVIHNLTWWPRPSTITKRGHTENLGQWS